VKCAAPIVKDQDGHPVAPGRTCARKALEGSLYCGLPAHKRLAEGFDVETFEGGFCVWCGLPGRRYRPTSEGPAVALCARHGAALKRRL
jgi:hypothetical protein